MPEFPIADGFYADNSLPISSKQCINWIPQVPQTQALSLAQLIGTPGLTEFADTNNGPSRGYHEMGGIAYSVNDDQLFRINENGTITSLGQIIGLTRVSIADNGNQMCIVVPGSLAYIYSVAGGLVQITDSDFTTTLGPSEQVKYSDGYFIHYNNNAPASSSPIFFVSALKDGLVFDALDFATAESDPDDITGIHVTRNQLYIGGTQTIEPFVNAGGADFPYQRVSGGVVPKGIKAKFSLVDFVESFIFAGGGHNEKTAIYIFTGTSVQKISTQAIDRIIQDLTDDEQKKIHITVYSENGGFFANVHLPNRVLTFDSAASELSGSPKWHERKSKDKLFIDTTWRVNGIINAYGKTLVTDSQDGRIGELDLDTYTEYGLNVNRIFSITPFQAQGDRFTVHNLELTVESGVGLKETKGLIGAFSIPSGNDKLPYTLPFILAESPASLGVEPVISRSYSDDGGKTFSNQTSRKIGRQGEYNKRQIWRKDGQADRFRTYRFTLSDPVKPVVIKLEADIRVDR